MLIVDLIAGALIVGMAAWGLRLGLAASLPVGGFAAGAVAGALLAPRLLHDGSDAEFSLVLALPGALLLGALLAAIVERATSRRRRRRGGHGKASAVGGALVGGCAGAVAAWLIGVGLAQVNPLRDPVQGSRLVGELNTLLPAPGPKPPQSAPFDVFPTVTVRLPPIPAGDGRLERDPDVRIADRSVVRIVVTTACGRGLGSGWIGADAVVVTNAHVVAAARSFSIQIQGTGRAHPARAVFFDPVNDLALLWVPTLGGVRTLPIVGRPRPGTPGAELGFPLGRHDIRRARIGPTTSRLRGRLDRTRPDFPVNLFGRLVTAFSGTPQPGNSGGPVVDARGRVLTTAFAAAGGLNSFRGGLGVPNRYVTSALRRVGRRAVDTGSCRSRDR